ncbi:MAG: VWA domain-containing protein [Deltaproteobacteria bacterium]|nr:VWA domain-containing protein [Deltaproteobacteria bacterium]
MTHEDPSVARLCEGLDDAWDEAMSTWADFLLLRAPEVVTDGAIAWIDLKTRQVSVNAHLVAEGRLWHCLPAIFAHEIGHHLRHPATLEVQARLILLGRSLWPGKVDTVVVNLFADYLINRELGEKFRTEFCDIYRSGGRSGEPAPPAVFFLSLFEETWKLAPGTLTGDGLESLEREFPGALFEARRLVYELRGREPEPDLHFIRFASAIARFIDDPEWLALYACGGPGEPSADDWSAAVAPTASEKNAVDRALAEGRITKEQADRAMRGLRVDLVPPELRAEALDLLYRRAAQRYLVRLTSNERRPEEPLVPGTIEPWEMGDSVAHIDWVSTSMRGGLSTGTPEKRERLPDEEDARTRPPLLVEIYLDVSGSMPSPDEEVNAMTLSAIIVAISAVRAKAKVRGVMYSNHATVLDWSRSVSKLCRFFLSRSGGGTNFPFDLLEESLSRHRGVLRVIISDLDFVQNVSDGRTAQGTLRRAVESGLAVVLHSFEGELPTELQRLGIRVVMVDDASNLPAAAAKLASSLFSGRTK